MTAVIAARNLVLGHGSKVAVASSSFEIPAGSLTAVIGPNGSGKSTLLNGIAGLIRPTAGSIEVAGAAPIAYVLQATRVNESLPITVRELVAMGRYAGRGLFGRATAVDRAVVREALDTVGMTALAEEHLHDLSGGQRQRVFLAQGLVQRHSILLLDEPLTGLDLVSAQAIDDVIHAEHDRGHTVVMTTHDLTEAGNADFVLLLANRVVDSGPPGEVITEDNLRAAYGPSLLHGGGFIVDEPTHVPNPDDFKETGRTIHVEGREADLHGG